MSYDLSILIPARNEEFISNTVENILKNKRGNTEILIGLDGEWASPPIKDHPDVKIVYVAKSIGQRGMQNLLARLSTAKYVMKADAHCAFDEGFDQKMLEAFKETGDNVTMVPEMRNLWAYDWKCTKCGSRWYQGPQPDRCMKRGKNTSEVLEHPECDGKEFIKRIVFTFRPDTPHATSYRFDNMLHFQYFDKWKRNQVGDLVESMSLQGSCFMTDRQRYWDLELCDESWGSWGQQGSEVAIKTRTSGGKVICNRGTWYAHLFRTQPGFSFPYPQSGTSQQKARDICNDTFKNARWAKQIYPLSKIVEQFIPVDGWTDEDLTALKKQESATTRSGIYLITSTSTKRMYVGSAANIAERIYEHTRKLKQGRHYNTHLQNTWNKYGKEDLLFSVLYFCPEKDLIVNEQKYIDEYKDRFGWDNLFNMSPTAGNTLGKACSMATKAKISVALTGKVAWNRGLTLETDERVKKYAEKTRGKSKWSDKEHPRGMLGKTHTEDSKHKIGVSSKLLNKNRTRNQYGKFAKEME